MPFVNVVECQETLGSQDQQEAWEYQEEVSACQEHQEVLELQEVLEASSIQQLQVLDVAMSTLGQIWMTI